MDGLAVIGIAFLPDPLHLQTQEEARHHRVIPAVALSAHAAHQAMRCQQRLMRATRVLRASLGMHDKTRAGIALSQSQSQSHFQSCAFPCCRHLGRHGPADNCARMQVQHGGQIQPAAAGTDMGDISRPGPIRQELLGLGRASMLGETARPCRLSVVQTNLRFQTGRSSLACIRVRIRCRPLLTPCCCRAAHNRRLPQARHSDPGPRSSKQPGV